MVILASETKKKKKKESNSNDKLRRSTFIWLYYWICTILGINIFGAGLVGGFAFFCFHLFLFYGRLFLFFRTLYSGNKNISKFWKEDKQLFWKTDFFLSKKQKNNSENLTKISQKTEKDFFEKQTQNISKKQIWVSVLQNVYSVKLIIRPQCDSKTGVSASVKPTSK